jgi:ABC-2 type transport system permease protein
VSIEGESIWIGQSLPVDSWLILRAKLILHITMTAVPAALIGVLMGVVMDVVWWEILLTVAVAIVGTSLFAAMDLAANLKLPNLHWTNETVAVKQSISVMIGMFGGWGLCLATIGGYFLFGKYLPVWAYFSIWIAVFTAAVAVLSVWLKKRGSKIYDNL